MRKQRKYRERERERERERALYHFHLLYVARIHSNQKTQERQSTPKRREKEYPTKAWFFK